MFVYVLVMPQGSSRGIALHFLMQYRRVKTRAACVRFFILLPLLFPLFKGTTLSLGLRKVFILEKRALGLGRVYEV